MAVDKTSTTREFMLGEGAGTGAGAFAEHELAPGWLSHGLPPPSLACDQICGPIRGWRRWIG